MLLLVITSLIIRVYRGSQKDAEGRRKTQNYRLFELKIVSGNLRLSASVCVSLYLFIIHFPS